MPGTYNYGLGSWRWDPAAFGGLGSYVAPPGSVCVLDFRNWEQQSQPNLTDGCGLFASASALPDDCTPLGSGYAPDLMITPTARQEMQLRLGLSGLPTGDTLAQAIVSCFMDFGDPSGVSFARPIDLNAAGDVELWLEGHSCVHRERYDYRELLADKPKGRANRLRDLARLKLDIADSHGKLGEALGLTLMRCGYSQAEVAAGAKGRKSEWQQLVSQATRTKHGSKLAAKEPRTQLVELWPTNGAITSGQTYTWAEVVVSTWATGSSVSGNKLGNVLNGSLVHGARCMTPVSSADHWTQGNLRVNGTYQAQLYSRLASAAETGYVGGFYANGALNTHFVTKYVAGVGTTLSTGANITPTMLPTAALGKMRSSASTQSFELSGFSTLTVTDSSIVGNLCGGAGTVDTASNHTNYVGPVTIDDGLASGGPWPHHFDSISGGLQVLGL